VEASPKLGSAIITICTEESYSNPNPDQPYDPEWTLVHELLHLRFSPINTMFGKKLGEAEVQYERGIDKLALALVELRRGK
jgi:hypothetical protein